MNAITEPRVLPSSELLPLNIQERQDIVLREPIPVFFDKPWGSPTFQSIPLTKVSLGSLLDDRLRLRIPVTVRIEQEGEFYTATCDEFEEFGYGYYPLEAVDDFRRTLAELYWSLSKDETRLAPGLTQIWQRLTQVIKKA